MSLESSRAYQINIYLKKYNSKKSFMSAKQLIRHSWTKEEDARLSELVLEMGEKRWQAISDLLQKSFNIQYINGKACRERYKNHLAENVSKAEWSQEEVGQLFQLYRVHGAKWSEISKHLPGRAENGIKNYFYATLRRSLRRMLKCIGGQKSSNQLGKVKPHVLTQLFDLSEGCQKFKELADIVYDVVINFSEEKSKQLTQEQMNNYRKVVENLETLNDEYIREKEEQRESQKQRQKQKQQQLQSKIIYRIKRYIKETKTTQSVIERIRKGLNVFKDEAVEARRTPTPPPVRKYIKKQESLDVAPVKGETEDNDHNSLQFVQPSQMQSMNQIPQIFSAEQLTSAKHMFPMQFFLPMDTGLYDQYNQQKIQIVRKPNFTSSESNLIQSHSLKSLHQRIQENMMSGMQHEENEQRQDSFAQPIQSFKWGIYDWLIESQRSNPKNSDLLNSRLQSRNLRSNDRFVSQGSQRSAYRLSSHESNHGTIGESIKNESQQVTDQFVVVAQRRPDPLRQLEKMQQ